MKKVVIISFLCGYFFSFLQAQTALFVKEKNNSQASFNLKDLRKITFSSGNLVVTRFNGNYQSFQLSNIRFLNFENLTTAINDKMKPEVGTLVIYPNPTEQVLNIQGLLMEDALSTIEIISLEGKVFYKKQLGIIQCGIQQIDVQKLPKGLYILRINNGNQIKINRFLKN